MATVVQTYIVEETVDLIYDNEKLEKWNAHVEALGLQGQKQIIKPEKSPIPFLPLNTSMKNIVETLCPREVDVEDFNVSPIPLEILDLISLSKNEKYFNKIAIHYNERNPDPFCIGSIGHWYQSTWSSDRNASLDKKEFASKQDGIDAGAKKDNMHFFVKQAYVLGKWGDVKQSWEELKQIAIKRYLDEQEAYYTQQMTSAKEEIDRLPRNAAGRFR